MRPGVAEAGVARPGAAGAGVVRPGVVPLPAADQARAALAALAGIDAATLTAVEQADCLRELERAESALTAARSVVLAGFDAACAFQDDAHGSARTWLKWQTRVTGAAAGTAVGWMRRLSAHPAVRDALAAGTISVSWARAVCDWTDLLPAHTRADADLILLAAADSRRRPGRSGRAGRGTPRPDRAARTDGGDDGFDDRAVRLATHYRGAGKLGGDLTPRCAAAVQAVLDALGKKAGPEDTRTQAQRYHDALEDAMRRLIAAGGLPDRAGQPTQIQLVMTLDQLTGLGGTSRRTAGTRHRTRRHRTARTGGRAGGGWAGPGTAGRARR